MAFSSEYFNFGFVEIMFFYPKMDTKNYPYAQKKGMQAFTSI